MSRKWFLISILICLFLSCSCIQTSQPNTPTPFPPGLFITPLTVAENPMEMIEEFAKQTSVAQTEAANPYRSSQLDLTQTPSAFFANKKMLYVVFPDGNRVAYSPLDLASIPQMTVSADGQDVKGTSLLAILERAGWGAYDAVAVSVNGIGSLTIPKERVGEDFALIFTGFSLRFVSPSIPENMWIEGVTIVEVH
jgi:hypothetical protein